MIRSAFFTVIAVSRVFSKSVEPHGVRTGIVPIFDGRITNEPITFTYTTAPPTNFVQSSAYPVQFKNPPILPTLSPINYKDSLVQTNYKTFNEKWQYSPAQPVPFNEIQTTPTYNQAQYYRMIQADLQSTPPPTTNSPYKDIWSHISDKWQNTKKTLFDSGIERDWRSLWGKLSGAMEPFMADLAEQMGRVVNAFIKQQNNRMKKLQQPIINPLRFFRSERSSKTDEESNRK
ncbi:hypothetical protein V3C99_014339 [Haemonchus contortus]|uniref:DUF148 domain-containing protein n=1 Tax=Haemonchus contortus TaxID=6289 RepID=A0A7I4YU04_HAECO